jgi:hypothetical protein
MEPLLCQLLKRISFLKLSPQWIGLFTKNKNKKHIDSNNCYSRRASVVWSSSVNSDSDYSTTATSRSQRVSSRYNSTQRFKATMLPSLVVVKENNIHRRILAHMCKQNNEFLHSFFSLFCSRFHGYSAGWLACF